MTDRLPPTSSLFRDAFGGEARRQRQEELKREAQARAAYEAMERRRQHFAALRAAQREE
jgi:hypothetical protein